MGNKSVYEKLTPQRQKIVDAVLTNLEKGTGLWKEGWINSSLPESFATKKPYRGVNNFYLTLVSMVENYQDNRWLTYNQIKENGYTFKKDEGGNSLAKGKGVEIEFFEFFDRNTKKIFDKSVLDDLTLEEKEQYLKDNVYAHRKFYHVFNGDLVLGLPKKEIQILDEKNKNDRAEMILFSWSKEETPIIYGGSRAYYNHLKDEIHLPKRDDFLSYNEFYSTALHEIGHSTGHEKRLNRDLKSGFGSKSYAIEELRAEIASMFIEQDLGIPKEEKHIENNTAYIKSWYDVIKEDPNVLFMAIQDADKICKYVMSKEKNSEIIKQSKQVIPYAIVEKRIQDGEKVYKAFFFDNDKLSLLIDKEFNNLEDLEKEIDKINLEKGKQNVQYKKVTYEELTGTKMGEPVNLIKPSMVNYEISKGIGNITSIEKNLDKLTKINDKEIIDKLAKGKDGDKFISLYEGKEVFETKKKDMKSLMMRLAMYSNSNKETALRLFKSSGQYNPKIPNAYYDKLANDAIDFIDKINKNSIKINVKKTRQSTYSRINSKV